MAVKDIDQKTLYYIGKQLSGSGITWENGQMNVESQPGREEVNVAVAIDALHNINNRPLTNFFATETSIDLYPVIKISFLENGTPRNCSKEEAARYMSAQNGSTYVPEYNYNQPRYPYIVFADGKLYKPQWDSTNGLLLYYMNQFTNKTYTDQAVKTITSNGSNLTITHLSGASETIYVPGGEKGETGPTGPMGPTGPAGPTGPVGASFYFDPSTGILDITIN